MCLCVCVCLWGHQWGLSAAVCGFVVWEEQSVFGQHGHGSQHERYKQVQMDVVPRAVEPPVRTRTHTRAQRNVEKCVYRRCQGVNPVKDAVSKHTDSSRVNSWSWSRLSCRIQSHTFVQQTGIILNILCVIKFIQYTWFVICPELTHACYPDYQGYF